MPITNKGGPGSDDDDDFFKPTSNSTLAKLFGVSSNATASKNIAENATKVVHSTPSKKISERYGASSFRYMPPQEVVDSTTESGFPECKPSADWRLTQASVVTAYKLVNQENTPQGKLGLAVLRSGSEFRILIYRTKTDALATINLSSTTKLFLKKDYLQFQSDDGSFWSVLFENSVERDSLVKMIQDACILEMDQPSHSRIPPVPASRIIPIVEEPDSDAEKGKASLISRMARVGQSILPQEKPVSTTEVSDSSDTDARFETIPRPNIPSHRRSGNGNAGKMQPASLGMQIMPSAANALTTAIAGQNLLHTATDVNFNLFMTESRVQGTEVRMNLSKLESKLDRVLDKIDLLSLNSSGESSKLAIDRDEDILALEEKILELKKENHLLKGKLRNVESEINAQNELQEKLRAFQKEAAASREKRENDLKEVEQIKYDCNKYKELLHDKTKEVELLMDKLKEAYDKHTVLAEKNVTLTKEIKNLHETINDLEEKFKNTQSNLTEVELIKTIMNNCFQRMCDQISDTRTLKIIGQTIKQETNFALAQRKLE